MTSLPPDQWWNKEKRELLHEQQLSFFCQLPMEINFTIDFETA